ncbi:MAG: site-specific integrase [Chloroflexota bacterium]
MNRTDDHRDQMLAGYDMRAAGLPDNDLLPGADLLSEAVPDARCIVVDGLTDLAISEALPADRHPAAVYLARLAPGSRRTMQTSLDLIAGLLTSYKYNIQTLDWGALRYQHTAAVRALLAELYAPSTANKMLCALRGVLREAWRLGQMSAEDYRRAADVGSVRGETVPAGRELKTGQLHALMQVCGRDPGAAGPRDAAILGIMYSAGLRRAEIVALDLADYQRESRQLIVRGKGRKERIAHLIEGAEAALADWIAVRSLAPGPLFWPVNKGGKPVKRRLTTQAVYNILRKRALEAGIPAASPHDLRRTYVSNLLDKGADIAIVARMAGHANVQTTARYDRRPEEAKRKAADLLHLPYERRSK